MLSDHSCLHAKVGKTTMYKKCKLNLKKTNWVYFKDQLNKLEWPITGLNSPKEIDDAMSYLMDNIIDTIKDITPKMYITGKHRRDRWWNEDLRQMCRDLRVARYTSVY
jgi:hypothetical protein